MKRRKFLVSMSLALAVVAFSWGVEQAAAQQSPNVKGSGQQLHYKGKVTHAERKAAAARFKALLEAAGKTKTTDKASPAKEKGGANE